MTGYAFGDSTLAAERLALVADVFEESSRAFLTEAASARPTLALDLGCGPGHSTCLVASTTSARRTIGVDASPSYVELAAADAPPGVEFVVHDATELPLPGAPAELVFCRLLLAHLPDPPAQVAAWMTQVLPRGLLLVDEVEWIETSHPVLARYEELVVGVVAAHGGVSYAGPTVRNVAGGDGWRQRSSRLRIVPVPTADAARMYAMNLATWRHDPHVVATCTPAAVDQLARDLDGLATSDRTREINWGIRQVVFARDA